SVTDNSNHVTQCTATLTIADPASPPVIISCAPPSYVNTDPYQQALIPDLRGLVSVSNHCNAALITQNPLPGTIIDPGHYGVTLSAISGPYSNSCNASVFANGVPFANNQTNSTTAGLPVEMTLTA